jgi:hypothetical protein
MKIEVIELSRTGDARKWLVTASKGGITKKKEVWLSSVQEIIAGDGAALEVKRLVNKAAHELTRDIEHEAMND